MFLLTIQLYQILLLENQTKMDNNTAHLCVTSETLIIPKRYWEVRWITEGDHRAFAEPFQKGGKHGWALDEFRDLQSQGYLYCGVFVDGRLCSNAGLWKRESDVWEVIAVGTKEDCRRQGMANSVVYFIADYILQHVNVASYTANTKNIASICTAQGVGFRYCTNLINNDKWCANNPRPEQQGAKCPLFEG